MKRDVLNSPRLLQLKRERRRNILNKFLISLLGLVVIFSLLAYLSRLSVLNINSVEVSGNKVVETDLIKGLVQEQITGKYVWLFPKTNTLLYPKNTITSALANKFKRLKDINISVVNKVLQISVAERVASYTWCGDTYDANVAEKCYFVDKDGVVFDEAPFFSGAVYFKFYGLMDNFIKLVSFKNTLESMGLKPISLETKNNGDIYVLLENGSSINNPRIISNINMDLQNVAENLQAALSTEPLQSKFKNKYSSLEYIDLRFGNKVYDKFQ